MFSLLFLLEYFQLALQCPQAIPEAVFLSLGKKTRWDLACSYLFFSQLQPLHGPATYSRVNPLLPGQSALVVVHSDWCQYCTEYLQSSVPQELTELAAFPLGAYKYDCTNDGLLSWRFLNVRAYPTFLLVHFIDNTTQIFDQILIDDRTASFQFAALQNFHSTNVNKENFD